MFFIHSIRVFSAVNSRSLLDLGNIEVSISDMFLSSRSSECSREDKCNYIKFFAQFWTHSKTLVSTGRVSSFQ